MSDSEHCEDDPTSLAMDEELEELRKSTMKEVDILKRCAGQPHISKSDAFCQLSCSSHPNLSVCVHCISQNITLKNLFRKIKDLKHPLRYLLHPVKVSHCQMVLRPTYPYQLRFSKATRYGRDFVSYCISQKF